MTLYDIDVVTIDGRTEKLQVFRGDVLLIVNVASRCGFTRQYEGLESLERNYASRGFHVLGFPCNQFGQQEPGSDDEIRQFCSTTYGVSFPMFAKVAVNGADAHPLYRYLTAEQGGLLGRRIKWNFTKFLVDRHGRVASRHAPTVTPERLAGPIEALLTADRAA